MYSARIEMAVLMCIQVIALFSILPGVQLQTPELRNGVSSCARPSQDIFGSFDSAGSDDGIVARYFGAGDGGSTTQTVRIVAVNMVCEVSGLTRDSLSSISAIVQYECLDSGCGGMNMIFTDQYRLDCIEDSGVTSFSNVVSGDVRTAAADGVVGTLTTPLDVQCSQCVSPTALRPSDPASYCLACPEDCTGLGMCLGTDAEQCCNYYHEDACVITCPNDLVPNSDFDCVFNCGTTDLISPDNGEVTGHPLFLDSVVSYTCDSGYTLVGNAMRTCIVGGWNGTNPICVFDCGMANLTAPVNGQLTVDSTLLDSMASYTCDSGYTLVGVAMRTCTVNGWNGTNPVCVFDCGTTDLTRPDNGQLAVVDTTLLDSVASYTCDSGYTLVGVAMRTCTVDGWNGTNPICVFDCNMTDLTAPVNGQLTVDSTLLDSVASYTCDSGYTLVGVAMRTCIVGGWNGTNPICVFDCGMTDLTAPVNGQLTVDSTLLDSMASYTCDSGYTLVGDAMRTCTVNGWNGINPVCVFDCGMTDITAPVNGQLTVDSTLLDSMASYTCDSGYTLVGDAMRTCTVNGWNGTNPVCVFDCGMTDLTAPVNGQLTVDSTLLDSMASYTCDSGYTLVGVAMRTCTVNGWSGANPICVFDCGMTDLTAPVNGQLTVNSTLLDSMASYTCDSGYTLVGVAMMRTCTVDGWNGTNPVCVFDCGTTDLTRPENGQLTVVDATLLDSVASYTCDSGYTLVGVAMRTCTMDGWNGTNPICMFDCGMTDLTAPEFGQLTVDSTLPDSVASYTCDSGYTLVGEATRTCTVNGWSGTNPVCELTSEAFTFAVTFADCETSVMCSSSNSMGSCMVQVENQDQDFSQNVSGPLNSPIVIPLAESTQFNFQATATIDSIATTQERNFTTGEFASRLTTPNTALLILGVIFLSMAAVGCIILVIVEFVYSKGSWLSLVMLVVGTVLIVVSVVLLVAMGSHVGTRDSSCDSSFQETRNGLIIAAFVFSVLAVIFTGVAAIALAYSAKHPCTDQKTQKCSIIDSPRVCTCRGKEMEYLQEMTMSEEKSPSSPEKE